MEGLKLSLEATCRASSGVCEASWAFAVPGALDARCADSTRLGNELLAQPDWASGYVHDELMMTPRSIIKSLISCGASCNHQRPNHDMADSLESPAKVRKIETIGHDASPCAPAPAVKLQLQPEMSVAQLVDQLGGIIGQLEQQLAVKDVYIATLLLPMILRQQHQFSGLQKDVEAWPGLPNGLAPRGKRPAPSDGNDGNTFGRNRAGAKETLKTPDTDAAAPAMARGTTGHQAGSVSEINTVATPGGCPSNPSPPMPHRAKRCRAARSTIAATYATRAVATATTATTTSKDKNDSNHADVTTLPVPGAARCSASACVVPPLDPNCPPAGAVLLKPTEPNPGDTTVWRLPNHLLYGETHPVRADPYGYVIVKITQCHGRERAAQMAAAGTASPATAAGGCVSAAPLRTEEEAQQECRTAAAIAAASAELDSAASSCSGGPPAALRGGVFVLPEQVVVRASSQLGTSLCAGYDREVVAVYRYYPCGDALLWMGEMAAAAAQGVTDGSSSVTEAVATVAGELHRLVWDMLLLVGRTHQLGYVICDHKLENMVYDDVNGCWHLIDSAAVLPCPAGSSLMGEWVYTTKYAAPEQVPQPDQPCEELWRNSSSDMFACGVCVMEAMCYSVTHFAHALGDAASDALGCALEQLRLPALHELCCNPEAAERVTAEQAMLVLGRPGGR